MRSPPTAPPVPRRLLRYLGILLVAMALAYFARHAYLSLRTVDLGAFAKPRVAAAMVVLTLLYAACVIPNAFGWTRLLRGLDADVAYRHALAILAFTQIGKYLPGNVGHHIGRIGLMRARGVAMPTGVYSLGYEALLAALASVHIGALVLLWQPPQLIAEHDAFSHRYLLMAVMTAGAVIAIRMAPLGMRILGRLRGAAPPPGPGLRLGMLPAAWSYLTSGSGLLLVGLGLWVMATALQPDGVPNPLFFVGAFAASWIAGFLAPGAPAGLGVREAVLSLWLGTVMPPAQAVLLVIALRIATTLGDLLNFLAGGIATAKLRKAGASAPLHPVAAAKKPATPAGP